MRVFLAVIFAMSLPMAHACAEWEYHEQGGAFGSPQGMAVAFSDENLTVGLALRCDQGVLLAYYLTYEPYQGEIGNVTLLMKDDGGKVVERAAYSENAMGRLRFRSEIQWWFVRSLVARNKPLSVAMKINGRVINEIRYSPGGMRVALLKLADSCGAVVNRPTD